LDESKLIESQRLVHEKEIQSLNLKLQNQIDKNHSMKAREKSLANEVESLTAASKINFKKTETLSNRLEEVLKEKMNRETNTASEKNIVKTTAASDLKVIESIKAFDLKVMEDRVKLKDSELCSSLRNIAQLNTTISNIERDNKNLKVQLFRLSQENLDLKQSQDTLKSSVETKMLEKGKRILNLEQELERVKADSEVIVEENERMSAEKSSYEKVTGNIQTKYGRCMEILDLAKDSLTGLTAMQEDTSAKLIEAIRNTTLQNKAVVAAIEKQFGVFEKDLDGPIFPCDMKREKPSSSKEGSNLYSLDSGEDAKDDFKTIKNAKHVAEDLSRQFDIHFGKGVGEVERRLRQGSGSGGDSGRERSRSRSMIKCKKEFR